MTRQIRSRPATPVEPTPVAASLWAEWPWAPLIQSEPVKVWRAFSDTARTLPSTSTADALSSVQAKLSAAWVEQALSMQSSWFELCKAISADLLLLPFGWKIRPSLNADAHVDIGGTNSHGVLAQMLPLSRASAVALIQRCAEAWKPFHAEDFVA